MKNAEHLTQGYDDVLAHQIRATYPGQAHFAHSGPFGATCNDCVFFGYFRNFYNEAGDVIKVARRNHACAKFYELASRHGPAVPAHAPACRYFERKEEGAQLKRAATDVVPEVPAQATTGGLLWSI